MRQCVLFKHGVTLHSWNRLTPDTPQLSVVRFRFEAAEWLRPGSMMTLLCDLSGKGIERLKALYPILMIELGQPSGEWLFALV